MFNYSRWILLNIGLPLTPFFLRLFIISMGREQITSKIKAVETPEILFFSIITCIIALNINFSGSKTNFESVVRCFLMAVIVIDFIVLGMIYSENVGHDILTFSIVTAAIPTIIALPYKLFHLKNMKEGSNNNDDE